MIIKVLRTQRRDKGQSWEPKMAKEGWPTKEIPQLLMKLNSIIEWNFVGWPKKLDNPEEEDKTYLGADCELKPGDAFSIGEAGNLQIIRIISDNKIGLEHTETGGLALDRLMEKTIMPEIDSFFNNNITAEINAVEEIDPENSKEYRIPYTDWIIFSDRFYPGRENDWTKDSVIKISVQHPIIPFDVYLKDKTLYFKEDDWMDDEFGKITVKDILAWFYNEFPRLKVIEKEKKEEDIAED